MSFFFLINFSLLAKSCYNPLGCACASICAIRIAVLNPAKPHFLVVNVKMHRSPLFPCAIAV